MKTKNPERWVMVTGSSGGIGKETVRVLAENRWNVGLHYRHSQKSAEELAEQIRGLGREARLFRCDLEDSDAGPQLVREAWKNTGGLRAWVHLAGADLLTGREASLAFEAKLELASRVDLFGTILTCREVGRLMVEQGAGVIVTIGWDQAESGMEGESGEIFSALKGAVMAFSRSLAISLAPSVRVNCVAPGWIKTSWGEQASEHWQNRVREETLLGRWGTPRDVAQTIEFLVSERAEFITGQTINVNGGAVR